MSQTSLDLRIQCFPFLLTRYLRISMVKKASLGCPRKLVNGWDQWVLSPTYKWGYTGGITH